MSTIRIRLKEDPREWRKSALFLAGGLALISSALRWRQVLPHKGWLWLLGGLGILALTAVCFPRWFRGYYRWSMRAGVMLSHAVARVVLLMIFFLFLTPLSLLLRLAGKDLLGLKRRQAESYWSDSRESGPLDRLF